MSDSEPKWLDINDINEIHEGVLNAAGGAHGIRDINLLESALNRAVNTFHYEGGSLQQFAATYSVAIAKNHAFIDGNKRTAFLAADVFLKQNGLALDPKYTDEFVSVIEGIADGTSTRADLTELYEEATVPYNQISAATVNETTFPDSEEVEWIDELGLPQLAY